MTNDLIIQIVYLISTSLKRMLKAEVLSIKSSPQNFKDIYSVFPCWSVTCRKLVSLCSIPFLLKIVEIKGKAQWVISAQYYKDISEKCHGCRHDEPSLKCFSLLFLPLSLSLFPGPPQECGSAKYAGQRNRRENGCYTRQRPRSKGDMQSQEGQEKSSTSNNVR